MRTLYRLFDLFIPSMARTQICIVPELNAQGTFDRDKMLPELPNHSGVVMRIGNETHQRHDAPLGDPSQIAIPLNTPADRAASSVLIRTLIPL